MDPCTASWLPLTTVVLTFCVVSLTLNGLCELADKYLRRVARLLIYRRKCDFRL